MDQKDLNVKKEELLPVVMVVVPIPVQSHLNQLLNFSLLVSKHQIPIHVVGSSTHNRQGKERLEGWEPSSLSNIHFHDFPISPFQSPPPDPSSKFPTHFLPLYEAVMSLRKPLAELLLSLSGTARRVVVVHDCCLRFAGKEATLIPNGESYSFLVTSAFVCIVMKWMGLGRPTIPGFENISKDLVNLSFDDVVSSDFLKLIYEQCELVEFDTADILNTCCPIEGKFIDMLAQKPFAGENKRPWAFGPFNPVAFDSKPASVQETTLSIFRHRCLEWLDIQPPNSVLYVAFGSTATLSDEQIRELALGLEQSGQKFIWSLREADRGDIYAYQGRRIELPEGYEERVKERGIIVRDWAPQLQILAHKSTGGFLSHCGWASSLESLTSGVPIAAYPMYGDQSVQTLLLTQILKVGLVARDWKNMDKLTSSTEVEGVVRKLMDSEEGNEVRKRAKELGLAIHQATSEEGSSTAKFNLFISHISRA